MDNLLFDIGSPDKNVETATVIRVATSPFYRSTSRGIRVRTSVEFMFGLPWNACSACRGICVRFGVEYADLDKLAGHPASLRVLHGAGVSG
jgi:hypothetical protein